MFDDTTIKILGNSYSNTPIKSIECDVQDYTSTINKEDYSYKCTKLLFVDYIEPLISENYYLNINSKIYKIIKVDTLSEHMEVYLFYYDLKNVKVNNVDKKVLVEEVTEKISTLDEKIVVSDFAINQGDLVDYQGYKWLVTSEIARDSVNYRSRIRKCKEIKYNNQTIYGLVESKVFDVETTQYFSLVDNQILITIPSINKVKLNDIIYFNKKAYSVKAVNDTIENTLILRCDYDMTNTHVYSIGLNVNSVEIEELKTYQIIGTVSDKGTIIDNPLFTYVVADSSICDIDNLGLITGIKAGATSIKVIYEDIEAVAVINVTAPIPPPVASVITYDITSSTAVWIIKKSTTITYTPTKLLNGVATVAEFEFEVNLNGLTTAQIIVSSITTTSIKIKNVSIDTLTPKKTIFLRYREIGNVEWLEKEIALTGIYG